MVGEKCQQWEKLNTDQKYIANRVAGAKKRAKDPTWIANNAAALQKTRENKLANVLKRHAEQERILVETGIWTGNLTFGVIPVKKSRKKSK
jgi:hypothetical protein